METEGLVNWKRGIIRILIVWSIIWIVVGLYGYYLNGRGVDLWWEWHRAYPDLAENPDMSAYDDYRLDLSNEYQALGLKLMGWAFFAGVFIPFASFVTFVIFRWIKRGFDS